MESLFKKITEIYNLDLLLVQNVTEGFLSENYILTDGSTKYFLKKYRFKNAERIREVHNVKKYFFDEGIPVIMPILAENKESFFEVEGSFYALFPFIDGIQLGESEITEKSIISLAETLVGIHLAGAKSKVLVNDYFKMWDREKRLDTINQILEKIEKIENKTEFDKVAHKNVLLKKSIIESSKEEYEQITFTNDHLIHGDYFIANVFFDNDHKVSHVFDFEKTQYAPRFFELFRSMIYCTFFTSEVTEQTLIRAKLYIDSYRKIYPASNEELSKNFDIYYLRSAHSVWVEEEHYLKNNNRVDELLKTDVVRINYLYNNLKSMKEFLFN